MKLQAAFFILFFSLMVSVVSPAFAETSASPGAKRAEKVAEKTDERMATAKARAAEEIDRRIAALNKIIERVREMKLLSESEKNTYIIGAQDQINQLTALKSKIAADTDLATLKTDIQSVFNEYRIFALYIPKTRILATVDRMMEAKTKMDEVATKLESRIADAKTNGKNVTSLETALTDMKAKLADAKTQLDSAKNAVAGISPDLGDSAKFDANKTALERARDFLKKAGEDLKTAHKDALTIRAGLRAFGVVKPSPTS